MQHEHAELSTIATALADLERRVTAAGDRYARTTHEDLARDLYEIERAMRTARRRLDRVVRTLRDP